MFKLFSKKQENHTDDQEESYRINITEMEKLYEAEDLVGCATMLKELLEVYGSLKNKNDRTKGREFIYFILSKKHKNLKNEGYTHWEHINKIISLNQTQVYPYHQQNLRHAMDFFVKELKGLKVINMEK
ncbi:MAG: hypothetical protein QM489_00180 [Candidatus Izemoplasma sp.]